MSNPFKQNKNYEGKPKRNTFDLSFRNHFTANFGQLLPVFCKPVIPGDHFRIKANFGLRFMPTAFPLMNKIRAHVHFFYVRNRNLWKDFPDFIYNNKENLDPPYMPNDKNNPIYTTGSLSDYLGVPTTYPSVDLPIAVQPFPGVSDSDFYSINYGTKAYPSDADPYPSFWMYLEPTFYDAYLDTAVATISSGDTSVEQTFQTINVIFNNRKVRVPIVWSNTTIENFPLNGSKYVDYGMKLLNATGKNVYHSFMFAFDTSSIQEKNVVVECYIPKSELTLSSAAVSLVHSYSASSVDRVSIDDFNLGRDIIAGYSGLSTSTLDVISGVDSKGRECYIFKIPFDLYGSYPHLNARAFILNLPATSVRDVYQNATFRVRTSTSNRDYSGRYNVYGSDGNQVPISALPYRAYESIYNAFYRDSRNNPFLINGIVEYNKYIPSQEGGLDTYIYQIHNRNWELDQFTSCVQSPQQGVAPLVGITSTGKVTFQGEDGVTRTYTTETADDADTITKVNVNSGEKPDASTARAIVDLVSSGISINDFRNVNAFQRWKETNIRRGMKLRDQTLARWGVDISYNTLDMPEFIGGISTDVDVNAVFQTVETPEVPLGSFAGAASAFGGTNNDVSQYCDEHGFIIGILSIVPTPVYDCILPKWLTKQNCLDYFNPEFDHIGMQPVRYSELCPVTAVAVAGNDDSEDTMQRTFGYQRPWYEYIYSNDEIHGLFRTQLRNFVLSRSFSGLPELNASFTTIQPGSLNNVFTTDVGDKIIGSISFDVTAKRPISAISIPSL